MEKATNIDGLSGGLKSMRFLVFKKYVLLFLLVSLAGCANTPNTVSIMEVCRDVGNQESVNRNKPSKEALLAASKELDQLEAEIAEYQARFRAYPRRHFVGARAKNADVALYMEAWRQKVEKFGNENYPETARKYHIYGKVQLTTSIKSDGSFEKAELDRSSGCKVLDDHALRIVRSAAPYLPFSASMKERFDILSITRTFLYTQENDAEVLSSPPN